MEIVMVKDVYDVDDLRATLEELLFYWEKDNKDWRILYAIACVHEVLKEDKEVEKILFQFNDELKEYTLSINENVKEEIVLFKNNPNSQDLIDLNERLLVLSRVGEERTVFMLLRDLEKHILKNKDSYRHFDRLAFNMIQGNRAFDDTVLYALTTIA
jgi:hypothetical protein